jgi:hypothetical protein
VRNIQQYPVLSSEWVALVDSLKQLARLVQLESRMPANTKVSEAFGRNADSEGTLWDQEAHENAIRILVEEAKVNLCLRMMTEYKRWQYTPAERQRSMQEGMAMLQMNEVQLEQKCRMFEESLGVLLMRAFQHKETLQLMDIPMLIEHCCLVFERASTVPKPVDLATAKTQETLAPYYFSSLMKHAEDLNNAELLAKSLETNLIFLAARHVCGEYSAAEFQVAAAEGFADLANNEDFQPMWQRFFTDPSTGAVDPEKKDLFVVYLQQNVVDTVLAKYPDKRARLRPLLDFIKTISRSI